MLLGMSASATTNTFPTMLNVLFTKSLLHKRLGYPFIRVFDMVLQKCNIKLPVNDKLNFCEACQFGKSHNLPFPTSTSYASTIFKLVHSDLWGPAPIFSTGGFRYYVLFVDDFSRFTWLYPLKRHNYCI